MLSLHQLQQTLTDRSEDAPHKQWSQQTQAAIVILWGLLIYPQLDRDFRLESSEPTVSMDKFQNLLGAYTDRLCCDELVTLFVQHDYIRISNDQQICAGTKLFSAVHALGMYRFFRSSVLARQLFQSMKKTNTSS